jgi:2-polyprenyl-6-methoxyphenol hydroxylase-like FAD-dependent oxidoreductase
MAIASSALIIGGGFSGTSAAVQLRKIGLDVTISEKDPAWRSYGAGLTLNGASLRALGAVGVLPSVMEEGFCADGVDIFNASGGRLAELPTPRIAGPDIPGGGGIMRPVLGRILANATRVSGASIRLGCTVKSIEQRSGTAQVKFSDGTSGTYGLVIGADGLNSTTRTTIFPEAAAPQFTGQGVWRAVMTRPAEVTRPAMYMSAKLKAGINPVSQGYMYLFLTEDRPHNDHVASEDLLPRLKSLLEEFAAPIIVGIRAELGAQSQTVYRPLESLLLPQPWHRGRVVLIGDAAHATTPHLAAGAGLGVEDAVVLAEELRKATSVDAALASFQQRRWERCSLVVKNSIRLGEIEQTGGSKEEHAQIMRDSLMALAAPF